MPKEQASKGKNKAPAQKGGKAAKGKDTKKKGEKGGKKPKARLTGEAEVTVREIFDHYDLDNNGALDAVEFQQMAESLGLRYTILECGDIISAIDENRDGVIQFEEFKKWWENEDRVAGKGAKELELIKEGLKPKWYQRITKAFLKGKRAQQEKEFLVKKMFIEFDVDGNGVLDRAEFYEMAKGLGLPLTPKEVKKVFNSIDTDNSGLIEYEEFYQWFYLAMNEGEDGTKGLSFSMREALRRKQDLRSSGRNDIRLAENAKSGKKGQDDGIRMSGRKEIIMSNEIQIGGGKKKKIVPADEPKKGKKGAKKGAKAAKPAKKPAKESSSEESDEPKKGKKSAKKPAKKESSSEAESSSEPSSSPPPAKSKKKKQESSSEAESSSAEESSSEQSSSEESS